MPLHSPVSNPACGLLPYFSVSHSFPFASLILLEHSLSAYSSPPCRVRNHFSAWIKCSGHTDSRVLPKPASHRPPCLCVDFSGSSLPLFSLTSLSVSSSMMWSHAWLLQVNLALLSVGSYSPLHICSIMVSNDYCAELAYFYICLPRILKLFDSWDFVLIPKCL